MRPALTAAILALSALPLRADVTDWKMVGTWDISHYSSSEGCLAYAEFANGTAFFIGFDLSTGDLLLDVTLMNGAWRSIVPGSDYTVQAVFGAETPWELAMIGEDFDGTPGLMMLVDATSDQAALFIEEFSKTYVMAWRYNGAPLGSFPLAGSRAAFEEVLACQRSWTVAAAPADPFAAPVTDPFR
ncbi:hypothetical protein HMH01_09565 [Halovulum dunhuangense]|uniref:Uncharacterized protein n=1 Tax=Halovulum dunhuangense TaxID=1505036 RepID=A0A849L386_9RHOB|nr:hypothetical protein [Halovulum dunhuangense]NNU80682.1 hypothetical protein [Halovulum dunhuangense]